MKKQELIIILILVTIIAVLAYANSKQIEEVCFKSNCFEVELAKTPEQRSIGLMNRESLDQDKGMLFIFDAQGVNSFWMKNTFIPLDIIWINKDKEIVAIKQDAQPCLEEKCSIIMPYEKSLYVLEINAGLTEKYNIQVRDKVEF